MPTRPETLASFAGQSGSLSRPDAEAPFWDSWWDGLVAPMMMEVIPIVG